MSYASELDGSISASQTDIYVDALPAAPYPEFIEVDDEVMALEWVHADFSTMTSPTKRQLLGVVRGQLGSTRATHADNAAIADFVVGAGGGGSGLPDEWTVAADDSPANYGDGALRIDLGTAGFGFEVAGPDDNGNANRFTVDLQDAQPKVSFGTRSGAEARVENDGSLYLYGRDNGSSNPWFWMYRTNGEGQKQVMIDFRSDASNRFTIFDNDLNPIFQVREDGSIHIPTGTSIVADL